MVECFELVVGKGRSTVFDIVVFDAVPVNLQFWFDESAIQMDLVFLFPQQQLL